MDTVEIKSILHALIDDIEDSNLLKAIYVILEKNVSSIKHNDFWDELPEEIKKQIEDGLDDIEKGNVHIHEDVVQEMKEKYNIKL